MEKNSKNLISSGKTNRYKTRPEKLKLRNWLNVIFMTLATITIALYFVCPMPEKTLAVFTTGCAAVIIKTAEVTIRMTYKHTRK